MSEGIMIGDILWSPVPEPERKDLKLNFFPINPELVLDAKLTLSDVKKERILSKADGTPTNPFLEAGHVEFMYNNEQVRLFIIFDKQINGYYVGFRDSTCGKESYPNGRLLLVEEIEQELISLDFNKAFNFACAYNEALPCPVTPQENWLNFSIRAGEKKYH
ncbi:MAG: DUF1684 domain-containing protein [Candidatus Thorarchaeota archaeon]|nr:DUF1684 domain-containing protein [Candidatus Thorarchaeota archaeon]